MGTTLKPITNDDLEQVSEFLHAEYNSTRSAADWLKAFRYSWPVDRPNNGFMLLDGSRIVGVLCGIYSEQERPSGRIAVCNITTWYVKEQYRSSSLGLAIALLAQKNMHFTNFSPNKKAVKIFAGLGFKSLDDKLILMPNLPALASVEILESPAEVVRALGARDRQIALDHADIDGVGQIVVGVPGRYCHVMFRRRKRRAIPHIEIAHLSSPELAPAYLSSAAWYFFRRYRVPFTTVRSRLVAARPRFSLAIRDPQVEMFSSRTIPPEEISYLYSEKLRLMKYGVDLCGGGMGDVQGARLRRPGVGI